MFQKIIKFSVYGLVFLMPLFWLSFSFEAFEFNKGYLLFILVSIGILAWLGKMIFKDKEIRFRRTPLDLYILGFLGVMILSAVFSQDKISSLLGFYGRFWPSLLGILSLGGFYFLITNNVSPSGKPLIDADKKPINTDKKIGIDQPKSISISGMLKAFLCSSFLVVLATYFSLFGVWRGLSEILAKISGKLVLPQVMLFRAFNPTGGSLEALAMFLAFISVMVIGLLAFRKQGRTFKFYILLFSSLFLLALIDFWPAWIVLVFSLVLFLVLSFWKRIFKEDVNRLSLSIFFIIVSLFFIFSSPLRNILQDNETLGNLPSEVLLTQKASWGISWQGFKENPVLGSGVGSFHYTFAQHKPQTFLEGFLWQLRFDRAGNHIAEMFGTVGILGILSYSLLIGMFLIISWMIISSKQQFSVSKFQFPLLLAFAALLVGQLFYYQNTVLAFSFWFILGLGVVSWQRPAKEKVFSFRDFPEIGLIFSVVFWVILFSFLFGYFTMSKLYLADINYRNFLVNPSQSLIKLERAAELGDKRADYHIVLARTYLQKFIQEVSKAQPDNQVVANMVALAVQEGKRAEELSPNRVSSQETLGMIYRDIQGFAQGALVWGIKKFERAIELEPKNPVLLTELGKLEVNNNKKDRARELFTQALGLKPDYVDAAIQLAILEESEGIIEEAVARLERLVVENPFSVEAYFQLGRLYYNQKEYDKAILQFQAALALFPTHSNSLYSLGLIYEIRGEREKALQMFDEVLRLNPANEDVREKIDALK